MKKKYKGLAYTIAYGTKSLLTTIILYLKKSKF